MNDLIPVLLVTVILTMSAWIATYRKLRASRQRLREACRRIEQLKRKRFRPDRCHVAKLIAAIIRVAPIGSIDPTTKDSLIHAGLNADRIIQHVQDRTGYQAVRLKNLRKAVAQYRRGKDAFEFCELVEELAEARAEVERLKREGTNP